MQNLCLCLDEDVPSMNSTIGPTFAIICIHLLLNGTFPEPKNQIQLTNPWSITIWFVGIGFLHPAYSSKTKIWTMAVKKKLNGPIKKQWVNFLIWLQRRKRKYIQPCWKIIPIQIQKLICWMAIKKTNWMILHKHTFYLVI